MKITKDQYRQILAHLVQDISNEITEQCEVVEDVNPKLAHYLDVVIPEPGQIKIPGDIVTVVDQYDTFLPLKKHPLILSQFYHLDESELKYTINKAIDAFKEKLKNENSKNYYFLPLPSFHESVHCRINDFPVRAILYYSIDYSCFVLTLDTIGND